MKDSYSSGGTKTTTRVFRHFSFPLPTSSVNRMLEICLPYQSIESIHRPKLELILPV